MYITSHPFSSNCCAGLWRIRSHSIIPYRVILFAYLLLGIWSLVKNSFKIPDDMQKHHQGTHSWLKRKDPRKRPTMEPTGKRRNMHLSSTCCIADFTSYQGTWLLSSRSLQTRNAAHSTYNVNHECPLTFSSHHSNKCKK